MITTQRSRLPVSAKYLPGNNQRAVYVRQLAKAIPVRASAGAHIRLNRPSSLRHHHLRRALERVTTIQYLPTHLTVRHEARISSDLANFSMSLTRRIFWDMTHEYGAFCDSEIEQRRIHQRLLRDISSTLQRSNRNP